MTTQGELEMLDYESVSAINNGLSVPYHTDSTHDLSKPYPRHEKPNEDQQQCLVLICS